MKLNITDTISNQGLPFNKDTLNNMFFWGPNDIRTIVNELTINKLIIFKR
jgi:hypothetical protein